ncbi:hypothetical protein ACHAWF_002397, partial [Thalassiosira exigua]
KPPLFSGQRPSYPSTPQPQPSAFFLDPPNPRNEEAANSSAKARRTLSGRVPGSGRPRTMRRSGSASCILRPKHSLSEEDLQRLAREAPTTTVLTVDRLPSYGTDRLYVLSELQVHANSIHFVHDLPAASGADADGSANAREEDGAAASPALPPSVILYLLWKPNTYPTPRSFADGPLSECVRRCLLANGEDVPLEELEDVRSNPRSPTYSPRRQSAPDQPDVWPDAKEGASETGSPGRGAQDQSQQTQQLTRIYVVVDRIAPSDDGDMGELPNFPDLDLMNSTSSSGEDGRHPKTTESSLPALEPQHSKAVSQRNLQEPNKEEGDRKRLAQHNNEVNMAEQLARAVASSRFLRNRIDGISIGVTSDASAAPGLEACMDAVFRGAKERRLAARERSVRNVMKQWKRKGKTIGTEDDAHAENDGVKHFRRRERALDRLRERSPTRCPVAVVALQPDDLEGPDHHHHHSENGDASPRILQCRVSTEWNGQGEHKTFADRAMRDWRQAWCGCGGGGGTDASPSAVGGSNGSCWKRRVPRISSRGREDVDEMEQNVDEPVSTVMVIVFLAVMAAYAWNLYGDLILRFLFGEVLEIG